MLRLMVRVLPVIVCLSVFAVLVAVLPLAGQSDPSLPSPAAPAPFDHIFLPLVANAELNVSGEYPPANAVNAAAHAGNSAEDPPVANRHTFITDEGGHLDDYWFRFELPNGRLIFPITVTAPVAPIGGGYILADGSLTASGLEYMTSTHKLSEFSSLQLQVWDVDHDAADCAEVDYVAINGYRIVDTSGAPLSLEGSDQEWGTWKVDIPSLYLKFPIQQANGVVQPAINEIAIDVDTQQCNGWAMEVDWGAICVLPALNYGLLFVHGWTGNQNDFQHFHDLAEADGYATYEPKNYGDGILTVTDTVPLLREEIISATTIYTGVNKVYVVAHSRGGIFTRAALRKHPELTQKVGGYVTLSTPHHGTDLVDDWLSNDQGALLNLGFDFNMCRKVADAVACKNAARSLGKDRLREFNYGDQCQQNGSAWEHCAPQWSQLESANSYAIVGRNQPEVDEQSATPPWRADAIPFPSTPNVDATFPVDHFGIISNDEVYEYIINLFDSEIESSSRQARTTSAQISSPDAQLLMPSITGTLTAGQMQSLTVPVEAVTTAAFGVIGGGPISVTLMTPSSQIINPDTSAVDPNVRYDEAHDDTPLWYYRYRLENPADGLWIIQLHAATTTEFEALAVGASPLQMHIFPDHGAYRPGQTITLETGMREETGAFQAGYVFTATAQLLDGSMILLTFYDDGIQGDKVAGDNLYTAQFTAPDGNGYLEILGQATKADIVRVESLSIPVVAQTATILGVGNERAVDTNGNGFFDTLEIDVVIDVLEAGDYDVAGDLYAGSGEKVADGIFTTLGREPFTTGVHTVTLTFDGKTLREAGSDGPYVLDYLDVAHYAGGFFDSMTVDFARTVYTTTAYTADQFEGDALRALTTSDRAADLTGDGLYDSLTISVTFDVLQPGLYDWSGWLVDGAGAPVAQAARRGQLDSQAPAVFTFTGRELQLSGRNGPYTLTNIFITRLAETVETFYFGNVHRTASYQSSQFASTPVAFDLQHYTVDLNGNDLYDQLVVTATVAAIFPRGKYDWSGQLVGPTGVAVGAPITGSGQLYPGKRIVFAVYSPPLYEANLDGAYSLQNVVISHRTMPTVTVTFPLLYTTAPYQAAQFDPWTTPVTGSGAQVIDIDENGLYDRLRFTTTLEMPLAGDYRVDFALVAQQAPTTVLLTTGWDWWYEPGEAVEVIEFSGPELAAAGVDGPLLLKLAGITYYPTPAQSFLVAGEQEIAVTVPYTAGQFQSFPVIPLPTPLLAQPTDDNLDGAYTVSWSAVTGASSYELLERRLPNT